MIRLTLNHDIIEVIAQIEMLLKHISNTQIIVVPLTKAIARVLLGVV